MRNRQFRSHARTGPVLRARRGAGIVLVGLAVLSGGCRGPVPPPPPSPGSAVGPPGSEAPRDSGPALADPRDVDGLLVAVGGRLQVTLGTGAPVPFDGPPIAVRSVTAAGREVFVVDARGQAWRSVDPRSGPRDWQPQVLPRASGAGPLIALAPDRARLAVASGELQGQRFTVVLAGLVDASEQVLAVDRGLNGTPSWVGPGTVAVNSIGSTGAAGFILIDVPSGALRDGPAVGPALASSADGGVVAVIDAAGGSVLVGDRALLGARPGPVTRIPACRRGWCGRSRAQRRRAAPGNPAPSRDGLRLPDRPSGDP